MKAVILAGGEATRLRPLTCNTTKIMVPVLNRPFLEHLIYYLKKHNITEVILALGQQVDEIQGYFGDGSNLGVKINYSVEYIPLGTAGAVKNAQKFLDDAFIVFNGDIFTELDLTTMMSLHREKNAIATIALTPVDDPTIYGVVETNADNRVRRFIEKPSWDKVTTNMINAGIYILEPDILDYIASNGFFMFERDVFPPLLERGRVIYGYSSEAYWIDIGTPEKYLRLHHDLLNRYRGAKFEGESVIHPSARIEGPVLVGEGCFIDKDSAITGPTSLGQRCRIEEGATIEGAVLWEHCEVGKGAKLRNCVVGSNCCIEAEIEILDNCVLGDSVRVGKGNKLSQGIRIWPSKSIEPNTISF